MTREEIIRQALLTRDPNKLYSLLEQALELAKFEAASKALAQGKVKKLEDQIKRQADMIDNLQKTLWKK